MKLSEELTERGFVHQIAGESLVQVVDGPKRTIYHGIDPSADSAHVGNMVVWMLLRHLSEAGHKIIFLVGGGTGMIGDPKPDSERILQEESVVQSNVENIKAQAQRLIGGGQEIEFVNNADWLLSQNLIGFLRDIGKHFTVNELVKKDAIASRLEGEQGISYTEFAYPLLQAFDYLTLHQQYGCDVQVGGSDQWGNIVAGVDLVRRKTTNEVYALTVPLVIDKATGKKFGKSEGNAVWLDADKTSPFEFFQFWLNASDESVGDYLKLYTLLSLGEIAELVKSSEENPGARQAQRALAKAVTTFVHGEETAVAVEKVSNLLFGEGTINDFNEAEKQLLKASAPTIQIASGTPLVDVLVASELASSKREARTFIESEAVMVNGQKTTEDIQLSTESHGSLVLLRRGKKRMCVVELV